MRKMLAGLAALVLGLALHPSAQAQPFNRNKVINSGNGAFNQIAIQNRAFGGGYGPQFPGGYAGGYQPSFGGLPQSFPMPAAASMNFNHILNSGNGQGNTIAIQNGAFNYSYPGGYYGGVAVGGVNVNVITNSGNGVGNTIGIVNH